MIQLLQDLYDLIAGWLKPILSALNNGLIWFWGIIITAIVTPVGYVLDVIESVVSVIEGLVGQVASSIEAIHIGDLPAMWSTVEPVVSQADAWVPVILAVQCGIALAALWATCALIRLAIRCLGAISGG